MKKETKNEKKPIGKILSAVGIASASAVGAGALMESEFADAYDEGVEKSLDNLYLKDEAVATPSTNTTPDPLSGKTNEELKAIIRQLWTATNGAPIDTSFGTDETTTTTGETTDVTPATDETQSSSHDISKKEYMEYLKELNIQDSSIVNPTLINNAIDLSDTELKNNAKLNTLLDRLEEGKITDKKQKKLAEEVVHNTIKDVLMKNITAGIENSFKNVDINSLTEKLTRDGFNVEPLKKLNAENIQKYSELMERLNKTTSPEEKAKILNELSKLSEKWLTKNNFNQLLSLEHIMNPNMRGSVGEKIGLLIVAGLSSSMALLFGSIVLKTMRKKSEKFASIKSKKMMIMISIAIVILMAAAAATSISYLLFVGGLV